YVYGGSAPGGFDCSGLVQWTYGRLGVTLPRTAEEQGRVGTPVSPADARPGDLVWFQHPGRDDHIGIYVGDGKWVVAPHTGAKVRVEPVDLSAATSIRRVAPDAPTGTPGAWAASLPAAGKPYAAMVQRAAAQAGVDPALLSAVAWTESGFNASATSGAGAQGLMQLMPQTAAGLGVDPLDPQQALLGGARYLKHQLDAFGGRADLALAAYNAGPTAVRKAGGIPPYPETQAYVTRVLARFSQLGGAA
ncbi:MAG: transglycosylase SLT domain-containing protein, partial [Mycobacteriales bacterium]